MYVYTLYTHLLQRKIARNRSILFGFLGEFIMQATFKETIKFSKFFL